MEIPAPTKQITLRPGGEELRHQVTVGSAPKEHHSPPDCWLRARPWGRHFKYMNGLPEHLKMGGVNTPISQTRKPRLRERKGHTVNRSQSQDGDKESMV